MCTGLGLFMAKVGTVVYNGSAFTKRRVSSRLR
jgi:hypothetical protein